MENRILIRSKYRKRSCKTFCLIKPKIYSASHTVYLSIQTDSSYYHNKKKLQTSSLMIQNYLNHTFKISVMWQFHNSMKERVSKLTYPTLQHCLRMLYTMNGNSKHQCQKREYKLLLKRIKSAFPVKMQIYTLCLS